MEQVETTSRRADWSFGVSGVPFCGKLKALVEQVETTSRGTDGSFSVSNVPFQRKLKAPRKPVSS